MTVSMYNLSTLISDTTCVNNTVHLVGGHNVKEGRVLVCYNGEWHSICSDNWSKSNTEADVVCSTLGYSTELGWKCLLYTTKEN